MADDLARLLDAAGREDLAALEALPSLASGAFSLTIATCASPALRDRVIDRLGERQPGQIMVEIGSSAHDVLSEVERAVAGKAPPLVHVVGFESRGGSAPEGDVDERAHRLLRRLNAGREHWRDILACPVVLWMPPYIARRFDGLARDFASWVAHRLEFDAADAARGSIAITDAAEPAARLSLDQAGREGRIAELQRRLEQTLGRGEPAAALPILHELFVLEYALGRIDAAEKRGRQHVQLAREVNDRVATAFGLTFLGWILQLRGDLDGAEAMHRKALAIEEELGLKEDMVYNYGNLGVILRHRGDLDGAEAMHRKALAIEEELGRKEGMAYNYGNLGVILRHRGDLDGAEAMLRKSVAIEEELGRKEGMASDYSNLGVILRHGGDLEGAEAMHRKALAIDEELGCKEGMAYNYGNLGVIAVQRGDAAEGRRLWTLARELYAQMGATPRAERVQGWLDELPPQ